jgi:hypothetical protein
MENKADEQNADPAPPEHHESLIERVGDELESRFLAAAEVATATTSAETNLADALVRAIEGPPRTEPAVEADDDGPAQPGRSDPDPA